MMFSYLYRIKGKFSRIGRKWDAISPKIEQAVEFAHKHINPEPKRMTDVTHYSMEYYLAHYGESINERYRKDRVDEIDYKVAEMVAQNTTDTDLILYRGVCDTVYALMIENAKDKSNCDLYEKGFLATSLVKGCEINCRIKLRIFIPAGTKCIYQGDVNHEQYYYEVDVMHGAELKIISIDNEYINCLLISTA